MLKIKDKVDLKELEKFGFVKKNFIDYYNKKIECNVYRLKDYGFIEGINIFEKLPEEFFDNDEYKERDLIIMNDDSSYIESPTYGIRNVIFDLINSDLVEKVEE